MSHAAGLPFGFQKALPLLPKGALVIFTGSIAGSIGIPNISVYSSTKVAVRNLARGWMLDTRERTGIHINVLSPGHTLTPGLQMLIPEEALGGIVDTIPLSRLGNPEDLGKAAVFPASDDSAYITGIELDVDGGVSQD